MLNYFTLQIFCILLLHTFVKITWSILNLYVFSDIKESSRGWAMKTFWHSSPYSSLAMKLDDEPLIVPTTFISGDEDRRWSLSPRWESSLMTLVIHRRSECPNPLLRTSCSIILDRNVVWRKLRCHRIYVNFTPPNERFFSIDTFARRAKRHLRSEIL